MQRSAPPIPGNRIARPIQHVTFIRGKKMVGGNIGDSKRLLQDDALIQAIHYILSTFVMYITYLFS